MGKYDKFYENYYKKLNSDDENRNTDYSYDEPYFTNNRYGNKHNNLSGGVGVFILIPILILGGFGIYKFSKTENGQKLYSTFLEAMSSLEFVSGDEKAKSEDSTGILKNEEENISDAINQEAKTTSVAPSSFVLDEDNIEMVASNQKYSKFVTALNGIDVKAKSEQGVVLLCKYKIIATSLSGVIDEVGENAEGYFLTIDHGNNIKTSYYNLPKLNYVKGESIKKGEVITEIKEEKEIVFKIKENDEFITPRMYLDFI